MRRNSKREDSTDELIEAFQNDVRHAQRAPNLPELLGAEGQGAARYFRHFSAMLNRDGDAASIAFDFSTRNRRPPTDPVNALLSYAYSLLARTWTVNLMNGYGEWLQLSILVSLGKTFTAVTREPVIV